MSEAQQTSSRMTPEIAARYQRTLALFEQSLVQHLFCKFGAAGAARGLAPHTLAKTE